MVFHKSYRDAILRMNDAALENAFLSVSDGTLSIKFSDEKNEVLSRGAMAGSAEVKLGDQAPAEVTFSYYLEKFSDVSASSQLDTFYDIVTKTGDGASWASTRSNTDVHCVNLKLQLLDKDGGIEEQVTVADFFYTSIDVQEGDPSKITISGKGLVALPTVA